MYVGKLTGYRAYLHTRILEQRNASSRNKNSERQLNASKQHARANLSTCREFKMKSATEFKATPDFKSFHMYIFLIKFIHIIAKLNALDSDKLIF